MFLIASVHVFDVSVPVFKIKYIMHIVNKIWNIIYVNLIEIKIWILHNSKEKLRGLKLAQGEANSLSNMVHFDDVRLEHDVAFVKYVLDDKQRKMFVDVQGGGSKFNNVVSSVL